MLFPDHKPESAPGVVNGADLVVHHAGGEEEVAHQVFVEIGYET